MTPVISDLMVYLKRGIVTEELIGKETVVRFKFTDLPSENEF